MTDRAPGRPYTMAVLLAAVTPEPDTKAHPPVPPALLIKLLTKPPSVRPPGSPFTGLPSRWTSVNVVDDPSQLVLSSAVVTSPTRLTSNSTIPAADILGVTPVNGPNAMLFGWPGTA